MSEIFDSIQTDPRIEEAKKQSTRDIPSGYIPVELSTEGKLYAPAKFHIRNFTTEDLMGIAFTDDEQLPIKVIDMVDKLVYEDDVSVKDFHEAEVIETLKILYETFYSPVIKDAEYKPTKEDLEWLANNHGGEDSEEYRALERSLSSKKWAPKVDIDLSKVSTYKLPENFKSRATIKKKNGFTCVYSMPKYGDVITLKEFTDLIFSEKDKQFASISRTLKFKQDSEERWRRGENINLASIPQVPKKQLEEYNEYTLERSVFLMIALRALHLEEINGQDLSRVPLEKRFELAKDPELDYSTFKKVSETFANYPIGVNNKVPIINPITNVPGEYEYPFRLLDILQAIRNNDPDGTVIEFE